MTDPRRGVKVGDGDGKILKEISKVALPVKTKRGELNRIWFQRGYDEGVSVTKQSILEKIESVKKWKPKDHKDSPLYTYKDVTPIFNGAWNAALTVLIDFILKMR